VFEGPAVQTETAALSRLVSTAFDEASHTPAFKGAAARIERLPVQ
jgi:hypothetical protein